MKEKFRKRYIATGAVIFVLFGVLFAQLINLQIRSGDSYGEVAAGKMTKTIYTHGDRGMITDVNSKILAYDKKIYDVQFYRDPTWKSTATDAAGKTLSAYAEYTRAILEAIEIVERYGGVTIGGFSLQRDPQTQAWYFDWQRIDISDKAKELRESRWRSNFYLSKTMPVDEIFAKLCTQYRIPESLSETKKLQVLSIWQEMQMNAFLTAPITIAHNVNWESVIEIETRSLLLPGISISMSTQRVYPNGTHMAHIVGYIGKIQNENTYYEQLKDKGYQLNDLIGLDGVEKSMEDRLTANSSQRVGKRVVEIDRYGTISRELYNFPPQNGNNIKLTIDSSLQRVAEVGLEETVREIRGVQNDLMGDPRWLEANKEDLQGSGRDYEAVPIKLAEKGAAVVVDVRNGRVLAMASYPPYDPNAFIVGGDPALAIVHDERRPLMNNAIASLATPGSIFKMVTASAAMATGSLSPYEKISDEGPFILYDQSSPPRCWISPKLISRHADQTIVYGLKNSCNYFFYTISSRIGSAVLYKYAALYGLTSKTGLDLPGELQSFVGNQQMLYDPTKAISAAEQSTWTPSIVANTLKKHLRKIAKERNISFEESKLDRCVKRLMDMAVDTAQGAWVRNIRTVLMEELDMSRELVYLQAVVGDIYIALNEVKWGGSQTIMTGIGQSITSVTPVAVARYVAAVANGGTVYDLNIIDSITTPEGELVSRSTPIINTQMNELAPYIPFIHEGMKGVVDEGGTASAYFRNFKYQNDMAGKTGTAQVSKIDLENNAWFVAYAPYENPEIAVVCYIPNGYSGGHAAIAVREIINYYMDQRTVSGQEYMPAANALAY
ncbi:MAG: hypothetical protein LBU67_04820 [Oscillospiraceae bacterium]|jgi:penicillin-binding protein 2|nr:hypothetical protein [Oscillospiraceae bacterium]